MKYNIAKHSTTKTPTLGTVTEGIKILLSHTSKDIYKPLVPMFFPYMALISSSLNFTTPTSLGRLFMSK